MALVILDTNFIMDCVKQKIHFEELISEELPGARIVVPYQVMDELRKINENKEKKYKYIDSQIARVALQVVSKHDEIVLNKKYVDKGIIEYFRRIKHLNDEKLFVATLDKQLSRSLKGIARTIRIKGMKGIIIE